MILQAILQVLLLQAILHDFFKITKSDIPKSLSSFLKHVPMKKKGQQNDVDLQRKCLTIGHAIISAVHHTFLFLQY